MRRGILVILALAFVACAGFAQPTNVDVIVDITGITGRAYWNPVVESLDGVAYLPGEIHYRVWMYNTNDFGIDDQVTSNLILVGETAPDVNQLDMDLSGTSRGYYYVGVQAIADDGQGGVYTGLIAWSYDPVLVDPTLGRSVFMEGSGFPTTPPESPTGLGLLVP